MPLSSCFNSSSLLHGKAWKLSWPVTTEYCYLPLFRDFACSSPGIRFSCGPCSRTMCWASTASRRPFQPLGSWRRLCFRRNLVAILPSSSLLTLVLRSQRYKVWTGARHLPASCRALRTLPNSVLPSPDMMHWMWLSRAKSVGELKFYLGNIATEW